MPTNRRVSLGKHAEEIRRWVDQGKSDGWIADALGSSTSSVQSFRSRRGIYRYFRKGLPKLDASTKHSEYEGFLEETPEGPAAWFDPAIQDDEAYREEWLDARKVRVHLTPERIVVVRV